MPFASILRAVALVSTRPLAADLAKHTGTAVSVIMATRNEASYLDLTLATLSRQLFPPGDWEVVVADDCSADDTRLVLEHHAGRGPMRLTVQRSANRAGLACAYQQAAHAAQGHILVFLSGKSIVPVDFLIQHLRHHVRSNCVVVGDRSGSVHTHLFSYSNEIASVPNPALSAVDLNSLSRLSQFIVRAKTSPSKSTHLWQKAQMSIDNFSVNREEFERVIVLDHPLSRSPDAWDVPYRLHQSGTPFYFESKAWRLEQLSPLAF